MQIEMFCQHFLKIYEATHIVIVYMTHNANSIFLSCLRHKEPNFLFIFSARKRMKCDIFRGFSCCSLKFLEFSIFWYNFNICKLRKPETTKETNGANLMA